MRQVYAIILEWIISLEEEDREKIAYILYDDMCHLKPFAIKPERIQRNKYAEFFGTRTMAVDFLHFKNHVGDWCKVKVNLFDQVTNRPNQMFLGTL